MSEQKQSLVTLASEMSRIMGALMESGGELTPEIEAAFDNVSADLQVKVDTYAFVMDKLEAESAFWKEKADAYLKVSRSCKCLKESLNDRIKAAMRLMETDEVQGVDMRFKLSRLAPRLVIDAAKLPSLYQMVVSETVPDKAKIKEALEAGEDVAGASFEDSFSLRKYVNAKKGK